MSDDEEAIEPNLGGRPRIELSDKDYARVQAMARIHCTAEEISDVIGMSPDTLDRRLKERGWEGYAHFYRRHSAEGRASLRRMQFKAAERGSVGAMIWLGKQILGQKDRTEVSGDPENPLTLTATMQAHTEAVLDLLKRKHDPA